MYTKKLNIAIILPFIITKNGTAKQSLELATVLAKRGHSITFFTFAYSRQNTFPEFSNFNIKCCTYVERSLIHKFIKNAAILEQIYLYYSLLFIRQFIGLFKKEKIDILNPHDWISLWVAKWVKGDRCSIVANINDVPERINKGFLSKLKLNIDRENISKINALVVLDALNKEKVIKWLNIDAKKVFVVRSGVDIHKYTNFKKRYNIKKMLKIPRDSIVLVCANLLLRNRRYEDAIYALEKLRNIYPKLHLVILSKLDFDKKYAEFLKSIAYKKRLNNRIHFIDKYFTDQERMMYIKNSDILIFPNSPQTWGLTVLEAMALGTLAIGSRGSGVSEVLTDGVNSMLYDAGNVDMLKDKLIQSLDDRNKLKEIAKSGQKYVLGTFSWDNFGKNLEKIMINTKKHTIKY